MPRKLSEYTKINTRSVILSYFVENNEALGTQMKEGGGPKETSEVVGMPRKLSEYTKINTRTELRNRSTLC